MKLLFMTNLFPNSVEQNKSIFIKHEALALSKYCELTVAAPVFWSPGKLAGTARGKLAEIPEKEEIDGLEVYHPRYLVTPGFGRSLYGRFYYWGVRNVIGKLIAEKKPDLIYSHFIFPDGYAAHLLARRHKLPLVLTARGSDINVHGAFPARRKRILAALNGADLVVSVSDSLKESMGRLGFEREKVKVIRRGLDRNKFRPRDRSEVRKELGLPKDEKLVLFIGNLEPIKGLSHLIRATKLLVEKHKQNPTIYLMGGGSQEQELRRLIMENNVSAYIKFLGRRPQEVIPDWLAACDVLCLPSMNEGLPNVVREALTCSRPVVASDVGGISELVTSEERGYLVPAGDESALAEALNKALAREWGAVETPDIPSWDEMAGDIMAELEKITAGSKS